MSKKRAKRKMDKRNCVGCEDNFYNNNNPHGVKECWSLSEARIETRFCIGINTPDSGYKKSYYKVRVPSCFRKKGYCYISKETYDKLK